MNPYRYAVTTQFHFCPQCGAKEFEAETEKNFRCRACGLVYYTNPAGTVVGIIKAPGGRIVLTVREKEPAAGMLDLPGGFIDFRETAEEALRREILEELSLHVTHGAYLCSMPNLYVYKNILYHTIDFFFVCDVADFSEIQIREEVSGYRLLAVPEIDENQVGFPSIRRGLAFLRQAVERGEVVL